MSSPTLRIVQNPIDMTYRVQIRDNFHEHWNDYDAEIFFSQPTAETHVYKILQSLRINKGWDNPIPCGEEYTLVKESE